MGRLPCATGVSEACPHPLVHSQLLEHFLPLLVLCPSQLIQEFTASRGVVSVNLVFFFFFLMVMPAAYGSSQARGQIRAAAVGVHHSHSKARSEPCLRHTPQLEAKLDPNPLSDARD